MTHGRSFGSAWMLLAAIIVLGLLAADPAWAGPGGQFAKAAAKNPIARVVLGVVALILLPLWGWIVYQTRRGVRETRRDLEQLAERYPWFAWEGIERWVREAIESVYAGWSKGDLSPAAAYLDPDYHESQQDLLDRWTAEGRRNHLKLHKVKKVRPLRVIVENEQLASQVCVLIATDVVDYLEDMKTGKVVKGKKGRDEVETIWTLVRSEESWLLAAITEGESSLSIASAPNVVDTSYLDRRAGSHPALSEAAEHDPSAQVEGAPVRVAERQHRD